MEKNAKNIPSKPGNPESRQGKNDKDKEKTVILSKEGKTNILLQAYISQAYMEDFALVSDMAYVAQNGARILRALLDIAISRKWATVCTVLMALSKSVEKRVWSFENPLKQPQLELHREVLYNVERFAEDLTPTELVAKSAAELGDLLRMNEQHGAALRRAAMRFPALSLNYDLRPLSHNVLRVVVKVAPVFEWSTKLHGSLEPWWIWLEDEKGIDILQWQNVPIRAGTKEATINFAIPMRDEHAPKLVRLRAVSDRWLGAEHEVDIPLAGLPMPPPYFDRSPLLDLPFLSVNALRNASVKNYFSRNFNSFNAIQTQAFWTFHHAKTNALLCAPTSCGKSTLVHAALVYVAGGFT